MILWLCAFRKVRTHLVPRLPGSDAPQRQVHRTGKRLTAILIVGNRQALRRSPGRGSMVLEVVASVAGVGEGVVGEGHLLVATFAGPLQDLDGAVKLLVACDIGVAVFALELVVLLGESGVGGLTLVGRDIRSAVGEPLAQGDRGNFDVVLAGLSDDFPVGAAGFGEGSQHGGDVSVGEESDASRVVRHVSLRVMFVVALL